MGKTKKESMTVEIFRWAAATMAIADFILFPLIIGFGAFATGVASPVTIPLVISAIVCTALGIISGEISENLAAKQKGRPYSMSQSICLLLAGISTFVALSGLFILFGSVPILWRLEIVTIAAVASILLSATFFFIFLCLRQDNKVGLPGRENPGEITTGVNPSLSEAMANKSAVVIATLVKVEEGKPVKPGSSS